MKLTETITPEQIQSWASHQCHEITGFCTEPYARLHAERRDLAAALLASREAEAEWKNVADQKSWEADSHLKHLQEAREAEETARRERDELERRLEDRMVIFNAREQDFDASLRRADRLERELRGLREALKEIAEHPHNEYAAEWLRDSSFATGHTNGHRCCAIIASTALAATNESPEGKA